MLNKEKTQKKEMLMQLSIVVKGQFEEVIYRECLLCERSRKNMVRLEGCEFITENFSKLIV